MVMHVLCLLTTALLVAAIWTTMSATCRWRCAQRVYHDQADFWHILFVVKGKRNIFGAHYLWNLINSKTEASIKRLGDLLYTYAQTLRLQLPLVLHAALSQWVPVVFDQFTVCLDQTHICVCAALDVQICTVL